MIGTLSVGYSALTSGLSLSDKVTAGATLSAESWNRIVDSVLELDAKVADLPSSTPVAVFDPGTYLGNGTSHRIDEWGKRLIADGSNNQGHARVAGLGTLSGPFTVQADISYSWGWGQIGVCSLEDFYQGRLEKSRVLGSISGVKNCYAIMNNNSNNMWYRSWIVNGTSSSSNITGFSSGTHTIKRTADNNIHVIAPNGDDTVIGNYSGTMKIYGDVQSPAWVRIKSVTQP